MKELMNSDVPPEGIMNIAEVERLEEEMRQDPAMIDPETGDLNDEAIKRIYEQVREHLRYNVKAYFHCGLRRPELYGRVEDAMVYYNYIPCTAVPKIVNSKIKGVIKSARETFGLNVECSDNLKRAIAQHCQDGNIRSLGARGILKRASKIFVESLSDKLSPIILAGEKDSLRGQTWSCDCDGEVNTSKDINWSV